MHNISFKLLLLCDLFLSSSSVRHNLAVGDVCATNEECRINCQCDAAYCDLSCNMCVYMLHVMDTIDANIPNQPCISEYQNCGKKTSSLQ
ncbi:Defensin-like (DEFL) family protein [Arabidopsis thaliana]|uniref:Putative defensin-like protein 254 n=1 Tax=Arabidopsis thaliana TaxID=3702 RepID=DF254_ARATH|nr:Defensin-like (DEFL) family protein [Arabidopsis thaliana]Q2V318.1 PUTATIVE PSEUDOGENE: RecName: Full=Putative defensin-like protein 254; Flags: Precursor [Arabidopsis thaliana]AED94957.1 Defensin-like (DEFL) family protein [Arabidopsis thaliana]|eukprot:NP_001032001.1 Defensin-like (DEFL) family protein [Arabidopsis thaliana]